MDKRKKIIISLSISLVVILIVNYVVISYTNSDYIELPVFKEAILKGKEITAKDITYIQVKKTKENETLLQNVLKDNFQSGVLNQDVEKGEFVTQDMFHNSEEVLESDANYSYISIPITDLSYPTCNKLRKGDMVTIYYTAKSKDVSNAIKDKKRLYGNTTNDGLVTCLLFETVEVISIHDNTGKETKENVVTDILVRLNKEDAILVANLKSQGTFDIVLN